MIIKTWDDVAEAIKPLKVSKAHFARRCNLSESSITKGQKRGSTLHAHTLKAVERELKTLRNERATAQ